MAGVLVGTIVATALVVSGLGALCVRYRRARPGPRATTVVTTIQNPVAFNRMHSTLGGSDSSIEVISSTAVAAVDSTTAGDVKLEMSVTQSLTGTGTGTGTSTAACTSSGGERLPAPEAAGAAGGSGRERSFVYPLYEQPYAADSSGCDQRAIVRPIVQPSLASFEVVDDASYI